VDVLLLVMGFLVLTAAPHFYLQYTEVCGCTSSLLKWSVLQVYCDLYVVVVGHLMKFIYLDKWTYPNCVTSVSSQVMCGWS
jgi:hypothetical protein